MIETLTFWQRCARWSPRMPRDRVARSEHLAHFSASKSVRHVRALGSLIRAFSARWVKSCCASNAAYHRTLPCTLRQLQAGVTNHAGASRHPFDSRIWRLAEAGSYLTASGMIGSRRQPSRHGVLASHPARVPTTTTRKMHRSPNLAISGELPQLGVCLPKVDPSMVPATRPPGHAMEHRARRRCSTENRGSTRGAWCNSSLCFEVVAAS